MSHPWVPYPGDQYWSFREITDWLTSTSSAFGSWVSYQEIGRSREGRPIHLLTIGDQENHPDEKPSFWLDGGTHAAEWTGVMSCLYTVSKWCQKINEKDETFLNWLRGHTVYVVPCISPDGFTALFEGRPFLRSSTRPARPGTVRKGFDPCDIDGDGDVKWMRWKDPAGPFVEDEQMPGLMRPRTLDDRPENAYFCTREGRFLGWNGAEIRQATREFGLDLNRNFPAHWQPFQMFGMDGGAHCLSEPESRAVIDAVNARPFIATAVTNHTYTGAILTQPSRPDTVLGNSDIRLLENIAKVAAKDTDYQVLRIHPDFMYDPKNPAVGLWSDTLTETLGIVAYTLELWDPFHYCGLNNEKPMKFFMEPNHEKIRDLLQSMAKRTPTITPWQPFDHPQLGTVEIGGLNYMKTIRNPPEQELRNECEKGFLVADRVRQTLPQVDIQTSVHALSNQRYQIEFKLTNLGYLSTAGLSHAESLPSAPVMSMNVIKTAETVCIEPQELSKSLEHLVGWGGPEGVMNALYPTIGHRSHQSKAVLNCAGSGQISVQFHLGRAGKHEIKVELPAVE